MFGRTKKPVDEIPQLWAQAQRTHQLEHAGGLDRSLPCEAVGHLESIDEYQTLDDDYRRKFCIATNRDW